VLPTVFSEIIVPSRRALILSSKITGIVNFLLPGLVIVNTQAYSDRTYNIYGETANAQPRISATSKGDGTLHMEFAGANPLVHPSPDIDTKLDMSGQVHGEQACYSGHLYGDAFPNAEVFVINSHQQATMLLTFTTSYDRNFGPARLIGNNDRNMGSFANQCLTK
jgi:hypothetical protein